MALSNHCPFSHTSAYYILTSVPKLMPVPRGWDTVFFYASETRQHLQPYHFDLPVHLCVSDRTDFLWDTLISIIANVHLILS